MSHYFTHIYGQVMVVIAVSVILPALVYFNMEDSIVRFFAVGFLCVLSVSTAAYLLGLSSNERVFVRAKATTLIQKFTRK